MRLRFCGKIRCGPSCGCGQRSNRRCLEKTGFIRKNLENTELIAIIHINFICKIKKYFSLNVYICSVCSHFIFIFPNKLEQCFLKFARGKGDRRGVEDIYTKEKYFHNVPAAPILFLMRCDRSCDCSCGQKS